MSTEMESDGQAAPNKVIAAYIEGRSPEFVRLLAVRAEGWKNEEGDKAFRHQRQVADSSNAKTARIFFDMMKRIGWNLQTSTGALKIPYSAYNSPRILDFCMAPGGFLRTALDLNRKAEALAFTLPVASGGHAVLAGQDAQTTIKYIDITMLAEDMGVSDIPTDHPDAGNFLPREFSADAEFDLIFCDGQVLRTHTRPSYRESREATRLLCTQMALGVSHVRSGGTMIVLLHKVELWNTVRLLYQFSKFSNVQLFKPKKEHAKRSLFYMIARNIQPSHPTALLAIEGWKKLWRMVTFAPDEYQEAEEDVKAVLGDFGPELVELGRLIWATQAEGIAKWLQNLNGRKDRRHQKVEERIGR